MTEARPLLEVTDLVKHYAVRGGILRRQVGTVHAVDGVSFSVGAGETLGLVGESGCGKSTVARTVLRLVEPSSGAIKLNGDDITHLSKAELRPYRRSMQIVFQDPFASLNPRMTAGDIVGEPLSVHGLASGAEKAGARRRTVPAGRLAARPDEELSASILRRPAPAHLHCARAVARAEPDRVRRAGVRARRLDPGAGDQSVDRPAAPARFLLSLHRARPRRGRPYQPPRRRDVSRPHRRDIRQAPSCSPTRAIPIRRRCSPRCRSPIPR